MTLPALGITDPPIIICIHTEIVQERDLTGLVRGECNILTTLADTDTDIDCYVIKTFFNNCLLYICQPYIINTKYQINYATLCKNSIIKKGEIRYFMPQIRVLSCFTPYILINSYNTIICPHD